jgi:hypothetical protein
LPEGGLAIYLICTQGVSAMTGEGINEALEWVGRIIFFSWQIVEDNDSNSLWQTYRTTQSQRSMRGKNMLYKPGKYHICVIIIVLYHVETRRSNVHIQCILFPTQITATSTDSPVNANKEETALVRLCFVSNASSSSGYVVQIAFEVPTAPCRLRGGRQVVIRTRVLR